MPNKTKPNEIERRIKGVVDDQRGFLEADELNEIAGHVKAKEYASAVAAIRKHLVPEALEGRIGRMALDIRQELSDIDNMIEAPF